MHLNPPHESPGSANSAALVEQLLALWPVQTADHALLFLDADALIVGTNPTAERILGYGLGELLHRPISIIFDSDDIDRGLDLYEVEVARRLGRSEDDRWHLRKDGSRFWAMGMLTAINDEHGGCLGFVKVLRDRTDLRSQISSFENRLAVADQALAARERFLSTFAHELSNPLNTLQGAHALIKLQPGAASNARPLEIAEKQLEVMRRLVDDLRDATRIDHGALKLELEEVDLQGAIRSAVELQSGLFDTGGQVVSVVLPEITIDVRADRIRLEQILRNLLDNAFKYSPRGGRVWVTATVERPMAVIRVRDEGEGISSEMLPRIFDMFTRDARAIELATEGLGIGLAVVKNLVQLHQGTIEVQTTGLGYGSEFTVNLPLWETHQVSEGSSSGKS
ncbi:MAG: PAS domain-containing sensor histidine kinase [Pseudomonadota bacterium]|nr:PAS domain-containing sensor histidine kinase [Pseudomonadota bacterium]